MLLDATEAPSLEGGDIFCKKGLTICPHFVGVRGWGLVCVGVGWGMWVGGCVGDLLDFRPLTAFKF